jgi:lysophospholipase L1-like esterase
MAMFKMPWSVFAVGGSSRWSSSGLAKVRSVADIGWRVGRATGLGFFFMAASARARAVVGAWRPASMRRWLLMLGNVRFFSRAAWILGLLAAFSNCSSTTPSPDDGAAGGGGTPTSGAGMSGATPGGANSAGSLSGGTTGGGVGGVGGAGALGGVAGVGGLAVAGGGNGGSGGGPMGQGGVASGGSGGAGATSGAGVAGQMGTAGSGGAVNGFRPCPTDGSPCKIMPFGDSITDGYNANTPGGYRVELFRLAHAAGKNITFVGSAQNGPNQVDGVAFPRQHEGHSGWTIAPAGGRSGISTLVATSMPQFEPHIVLLMIGTNDAIDNYQMPQAPERLGALIDSIYQQLPDVSLLVAQPIPARGDSTKGDDAALSARIKTFCDAIPAVVKQRADAGKHITVVDLNTPFAPKASLLEDQWHPNAAGYSLLAQRWFAALSPQL